MQTTATVIADSINKATGDRITTILARYPRIVHAEFVTHRVFFVDDPTAHEDALALFDSDVPSPLSRNSASSRAIPVKTQLQKAIEDPFVPIWRFNKKGMQPSLDQVPEDVKERATRAWNKMMEECAKGVAELQALNIAKELANRPLEWFGYIECLFTATEWHNFLLLRDHWKAQSEVAELARCIKTAMRESSPRLLNPGEWHMPYIEQEDIDAVNGNTYDLSRICAARCARTDRKSLITGKVSTIDEDYHTCNNLAGDNPKHLSPFEHCAQAAQDSRRSGNLIGWIQLRKTLFWREETGGDKLLV